MQISNQENESTEYLFGNKEKFFLDPSIKHLNHASYGAVSKFSWSKIDQMNFEILKNPDNFMWHRNFENFWTPSVTALANYLQINKDNLLLSESVTDGLNAAFNLIQFNRANDAILVNDFSYTDMNFAIDYTSNFDITSGKIPIIRVPMKYPLISVKQVIDSFDATCRELVSVRNLRIRLTIIDHITSLNGLKLPVKEICQVIRKWQQVWKEKQSACFKDENEYKTYIIIDGAHAFGQVKLELNKYDCDFYVTCLHKWFYSPWGSAFLYFKDPKMKNQQYFAYNKYKLPFHNFAEPATRNESFRLVHNHYIDFFENQLGGLTNIEKYVNELQCAALTMLIGSWKSKTQPVDKELQAPFVKCIELPANLQYGYNRDELIDIMRNKYNISTLFNVINGIMYCRISFAVYNKMDDYFALNEAVLDLAKNNQKKQALISLNKI